MLFVHGWGPVPVGFEREEYRLHFPKMTTNNSIILAVLDAGMLILSQFVSLKSLGADTITTFVQFHTFFTNQSMTDTRSLPQKLEKYL